MRHELDLSAEEMERWVGLEVTIGTNESLIAQSLATLQRLLKSFTPVEKTSLEQIIGLSLNLDSPLSLDHNPKILKLLMIKVFIDQHGLSVIREAKSNPALNEKSIFLDIADRLFTHGEYPEQIYVYSVYRQRGTPNTWLKVIDAMTPDQVGVLLDSKIKSLQRYINRHLRTARRFRFKHQIGSLTIIILSKPIQAKVIKGEMRNAEVQRASYTMIIFDKTDNKIGVVSGSKREVQVIQRFIRYRMLPSSIGTPRQELELDRKEMLQKILASNTERNTILSSVLLKTTLLPGQPALRLKSTPSASLDDALTQLNGVWNDLGIEALQSVDFQAQGKNVNVYLYGDKWKRIYINALAKRRSTQVENQVLEDLKERFGVSIKETAFVVEPLTDEYILEQILADKNVVTFPPVPQQVEKLIVRLITEKFIRKPSKITKRKCQTCYSFSWDAWECPNCDRESMVVVGEAIRIDLLERNIISRISETIRRGFPTYKTILIPYKQRRKYKKAVIRVYNPQKNLSSFVILITHNKDIAFVEDLLNEGFGVIAIVDPEMSGKAEHLADIGCDLISMPKVIDGMLNGSSLSFLSANLQSQERRILERIFTNLGTSISRLNTRPASYNEDDFEIDIKNLFQAIIPDVIRLGTEFKGKSVPDGYCCYGYRNAPQRTKRRLFGWDAKYSVSSSYRLGGGDLKKQKRYIQWLLDTNGEPRKMGSLGIYGFVSNFDSPSGFKTTMSNLSRWSGFPRQGRLALIQDMLLVKICEWMLDHWQQVINNNSSTAEEVFRFFRRKQPHRRYSIFTLNQWDQLKARLDQTVPPTSSTQ